MISPERYAQLQRKYPAEMLTPPEHFFEHLRSHASDTNMKRSPPLYDLDIAYLRQMPLQWYVDELTSSLGERGVGLQQNRTVNRQVHITKEQHEEMWGLYKRQMEEYRQRKNSRFARKSSQILFPPIMPHYKEGDLISEPTIAGVKYAFTQQGLIEEILSEPTEVSPGITAEQAFHIGITLRRIDSYEQGRVDWKSVERHIPYARTMEIQLGNYSFFRTAGLDALFNQYYRCKMPEGKK